MEFIVGGIFTLIILLIGIAIGFGISRPQKEDI